MLTSFRLLSLRILILLRLLSFVGDSHAPWTTRGIRLPGPLALVGFTFSTGTVLEAIWAGDNTGDAGCETQSSERESSQA